MDKAILDYALKILEDAGCDKHTYALEPDDVIMDDLKKAFPGGMEYPYVDVANAIIAVSERKPIYRAPWRVLFDSGESVDGIDAETLEEAKELVIETYYTWMEEEESTRDCESWNEMIYSCSAVVGKYCPETDEYDEYWYPSDEELEAIGWKELTEEEWCELCSVEQYGKEEENTDED